MTIWISFILMFYPLPFSMIARKIMFMMMWMRARAPVVPMKRPLMMIWGGGNDEGTTTREQQCLWHYEWLASSRAAFAGLLPIVVIMMVAPLHVGLPLPLSILVGRHRHGCKDLDQRRVKLIVSWAVGLFLSICKAAPLTFWTKQSTSKQQTTQNEINK